MGGKRVNCWWKGRAVSLLRWHLAWHMAPSATHRMDGWHLKCEEERQERNHQRVLRLCVEMIETDGRRREVWCECTMVCPITVPYLPMA
jgi:hypothetical protein